MTNKYDTTLLAKIIEQLCDEHHIAVKEMLMRSGLNRNVVDNLKKGSLPSVDKIAQIADYFDCSVDYLLGRSDNSQNYSNNSIYNSTNIAFGERSSVRTNHNDDNNITQKRNELVETIMIKKYDVRAKEYVVCPFCNANILKIVGDTFTEIFVSPENCFQPNPYPIIPFDYNNMVRDTPTFRLHIQYISCPYCSKTSYKIYDFDRNKWINIYPESTVKYFSNSVPKEIYNDYAQACAILTASPSASATLSRRCLQRMIRDRWNIECSLLKNEINKIDKNDISKIERKALHAVKDIGNIGAHPNEILDVTFEDAELSIKIIEIFLQKWYIDEPAEQKLLSEAIQNNNEKQSHKKGSTQ